MRVKTAPQTGHSAFATTPDFSRWWRRRLLKVENSRPLQPCSQHWGLGRKLRTRTGRSWAVWSVGVEAVGVGVVKGGVVADVGGGGWC